MVYFLTDQLPVLNTWKPEMYFTTYCDYDISTKKKKKVKLKKWDED